MKTILKPFIFVIRLLFQILAAGTFFLFCCALFCLALYCAYHVLMWYGDGFELLCDFMESYVEIADKGMVEAAKLGNDLNWYMYYAFKGFLLFCVLFYCIPAIIFIGAMMAAEGQPVNVRVVNY